MQLGFDTRTHFKLHFGGDLILNFGSLCMFTTNVTQKRVCNSGNFSLSTCVLVQCGLVWMNSERANQ